MVTGQLFRVLCTRTRLRAMMVLLAVIGFAFAGTAGDLKILKMGLGSGRVTTSTGGIDCGGSCNGPIPNGTSVRLTATGNDGSRFVRWEGGVRSTDNPIDITISGDTAVRAVFELVTPVRPLPGVFTLAELVSYIDNNSNVNTPARFVQALPRPYKQNWILMSRSESLQTGTAEFPRLMLPDATASFVFTIGLAQHGSYPGSHPNAIEVMQYDAEQKNFRFHEIVLAPIDAMGSVPARPVRRVSIDDSKCSKCHSTRNVLNRSMSFGTTGQPVRIPPNEVVKSKNKPNWDAYDSWGGMMPFNRDRIYQGSVEAAAFRYLFNLWNWRTSDASDSIRQILELLELQPPHVGSASPHRIVRDTNNTANSGHIRFGFDFLSPLATDPVTTSHSFNGPAIAPSVVEQRGRYVTLRHSNPNPVPNNEDLQRPTTDEGRGVQFFDLLGGADGRFNQQRIADEMIGHRYATGSFPIDVRPIALAIARDLVEVSGDTVRSRVPGKDLRVNWEFFRTRNGMTMAQLVTDTRKRADSLPRRKADIQKINLDRRTDNYLKNTAPAAPAAGLMQRYGGLASPTTEQVRQEVFRRHVDLGDTATTIDGPVYVDREQYDYNTHRVALYRYFLEPLGVSVDKWSMSVRGRSRTYSFADVFSTYIGTFTVELNASLNDPMDRFPGLMNPADDEALMDAVNASLQTLPRVNDVPKYTDVQRIFNKSCIECHGGLDYPPYVNYGRYLDLSENEAPGVERLRRSHDRAIFYTTATPLTSDLYLRIIDSNTACPNGLMPCGGPQLSGADMETIRRWIAGPEARAFSHGDPHIRTIDGINYDFQAAGEFTLLRGDFVEIQTRHAAVTTATPVGPDGHTGLSSCVSLNTAVAMNIGGHRITYQPSPGGKPDPTGLQLRVDGKLVKMSDQGVRLRTGGRIMQTSAPGGIQIEGPGGSVIVITPGWWEHYQLWYLNIDIRHIRATEGLMGRISPGNWLPALPDGSEPGPKPADLNQRYRALYDIFGNAWRVSDSTSLFDYAPGTSTRTFSNEGWPNGLAQGTCSAPQTGNTAPLKPLPRERAEQLCAGIADGDRKRNCIIDVMATGEPGFAKTYLAADKIDRNNYPEPPTLAFPEKFKTGLPTSVTFKWNTTTDKDGDPLTYRLYVWHVDAEPDTNNAVVVSQDWWQRGGNSCFWIVAVAGLLLFLLLYFLGMRKRPVLSIVIAIVILLIIILAWFFCSGKTMSKTVSGLEPGKAYFWSVIAEDNQGGTVRSEIRRLEIE